MIERLSGEYFIPRQGTPLEIMLTTWLEQEHPHIPRDDVGCWVPKDAPAGQVLSRLGYHNRPETWGWL